MKKIVILFVILLIMLPFCGFKLEEKTMTIKLLDTSGTVLIDTVLSKKNKSHDMCAVLDKSLADGESEKSSLEKIAVGLFDILNKTKRETFKEKKDATATYIAEKNIFFVTQHINGKSLNIIETAKSIFKNPNKFVVAVYDYSLADQTKDNLIKTHKKIGWYTTYFNGSSENRKQNIKLAAKLISGVKIGSKCKFSFNTIVGERTVARGFKEAKIIFNGEYVKGVGGGVCQVSTTVYNAWVTSGLEVEKAVAHTLTSSYVSLSRDASVSQFTDMVLINNTDCDIFVACSANDCSISVSIFGKPDGYTYNLVSEELRQIPPPIIVEEIFDKNISSEVSEEVSKGKVGFVSRGMLEKMYNGKIIERKLLRSDYYLPVPSKIVKRIPQLD